jgi:PLP dependent protein
MNDISDNLARVHDRIAAAADSVGRRPEYIRLIAIAKTHSAEAVERAYDAGQRAFGESAVQEALAKIPQVQRDDIEWHFIGHLQSNKAKFMPGNFAWVHSLDSVKLAQRVSRLAQEAGAVVNGLIEVNVVGDPKKHGVAVDLLVPLLDELLSGGLPNLSLRGLMAIGPHPASEGGRRAAFAKLRDLRDECQRRFGINTFSELSMGMSGDYVDAIKEGATMVRIGTAIFGKRSYDTEESH